MTEHEPACLAGPVVLSPSLLHWYRVETAMIYSVSLSFKTFAALGWLAGWLAGWLLLLLLQRGGKAQQQAEIICCGEKQKRGRKMKMPPVE